MSYIIIFVMFCQCKILSFANFLLLKQIGRALSSPSYYAVFTDMYVEASSMPASYFSVFIRASSGRDEMLVLNIDIPQSCSRSSGSHPALTL